VLWKSWDEKCLYSWVSTDPDRSNADRSNETTCLAYKSKDSITEASISNPTNSVVMNKILQM
jgi:hypothetical protein